MAGDALRRSGKFEVMAPWGMARLQLRPDGFRRREVRVGLDGRSIGVMPYPRPEAPYQELAFALDGAEVVAATWLPAESRAVGFPLAYDVFVGGRSVRDGTSLTNFRDSAPKPGPPPPKSFVVIETVLRVAPAAAAPGFAVALARNVSSLGWQATIGVGAVLLLAVGLATELGSLGWRRIRAHVEQSARRRAILGGLFLAGTYGLTTVVVVGLASLVRLPTSPGGADLADAGPSPSASPCVTAIAILDGAAPPVTTPTPSTSLSHLVLVDPGEPATLGFDGGMDLQAAAYTRADPDARSKLVAAGFVQAYQRSWQTPEGRTLTAEIFAFEMPAGALQFHRQMTEYACRFSNEAYPVPFPASVGLNVRYSSGDPIVDQIGWVDGRLRIVVTHSFAQPPSDHSAIVTLARRALERLQNPD